MLWWCGWYINVDDDVDDDDSYVAGGAWKCGTHVLCVHICSVQYGLYRDARRRDNWRQRLSNLCNFVHQKYSLWRRLLTCSINVFTYDNKVLIFLWRDLTRDGEQENSSKFSGGNWKLSCLKKFKTNIDWANIYIKHILLCSTFFLHRPVLL